MATGDKSDQYGGDLLATMGGDVEEARRLAELFFETASAHVERMRTAVINRDRKNLAFSAHKCAGGAAACGLADLAALLSSLELAAGDSEWSSLEASFTELIACYADSQLRVIDYFQSLSGVSSDA